MKKDAKFLYAQSSDIKSRTYIEYRKDMKKKAIVELEIQTWLNKEHVKEELYNSFLKKRINMLKNYLKNIKKKCDLKNNNFAILEGWITIYKNYKEINRITKNEFERFKNCFLEQLEQYGDSEILKNIKISKHGGDKFLWFLRGGGITREPDYVVQLPIDIDGTQIEVPIYYIELQYADKENLKFFDFKISKIAKNVNGKRIPYDDRIFLYILKNPLKYAFIEPKWIVENSNIDVVPAWGNSKAYRVPKNKFEEILEEDSSLKSIIEIVDSKIVILNFQHELMDIWKDNLSNELQKVIDEEKLVKIPPKSLDGFFKVCFILDSINKIPENAKLWIIYLLSYVNGKLNLKEIAMLVYSLDFLYSKISNFQEHEIKELENKIEILLNLINDYYDYGEHTYKSTIRESPLEETRYALFSLNLIEDIIQDAIYYHDAKFKPVSKIYQKVKNPVEIARIINGI